MCCGSAKYFWNCRPRFWKNSLAPMILNRLSSDSMQNRHPKPHSPPGSRACCAGYSRDDASHVMPQDAAEGATIDTLILSNAQKANQTKRKQQAQLRAHGEAADQAALSAVLGKGRDAGPLLAELRKDGVTAIKNFWTAKQCESARNELNRLMAEVPQCVRHFSNGADKRVFGADMAGDQISAFLHDPFLSGMGEMDGGGRRGGGAAGGARGGAGGGGRGAGGRAARAGAGRRGGADGGREGRGGAEH